MPETYEYEGATINRETIVALGGDAALKLPADDIRKQQAARDAGSSAILASYRKTRGLIVKTPTKTETKG